MVLIVDFPASSRSTGAPPLPPSRRLTSLQRVLCSEFSEAITILQALKAAQSLAPARKLRKMVTLISTRVTGVSEEEAFCALAEMKGNVQVQCREYARTCFGERHP